MIIHRVEQGSGDWLALRLGIPTSSRFDALVTPTGKPSASAERYMHELLAEWMIGEPLDMERTQWMERGSALEPQARAYYEMQRDVSVETVGFVTRDDGLAGASPDGLVGDDGMLEIKCPAAHTHVGYLLGGDAVPATYRAQTQGQLLIAEREWVDFLSYSPVMPPALVRTYRDDPYIRALAGILDAFVERMMDARERLRAMGYAEAAA